MTIKTGVDMLQISRVEQSLEKHKFLENIFTKKEILYLESKLENQEIRGYKFFECLAGLFCAKEAVLKALGIGMAYMNILKDVEVCHKSTGEPFALIHGKLLKKFPLLTGKSEIAISIAHDGGFAIASCILVY